MKQPNKYYTVINKLYIFTYLINQPIIAMLNISLKNKALALCMMLFLQFTIVFAQSPQIPSYPPAAQVAHDFKALLNRPKVPFRPSFKTIRSDDSLIVTKGFIYSEATEKVPVLIYKPVIKGQTKFPVVIFLHGTANTKDDADIRYIFTQLAAKGIMGVAIDARYHGERIPGGAHGAKEYTEAAYRAFKNTDKAHQEHPFFYDTCWDIWRLTDYLVTRPDVNINRIGMGGISMGGIQTWLAASVDPRIKVSVLDIAVQSFKWSLDNNHWQGRVHTIQNAHEKVAHDMGDAEVNQKNVKAMWDKIIPGITGEFDCPSMMRLLAPRRVLVLSNDLDQNCPLPGAQIAFATAKAAYAKKNALNKLDIHISVNEPHRTSPEHMRLTIAYFTKWL